MSEITDSSPSHITNMSMPQTSTVTTANDTVEESSATEQVLASLGVEETPEVAESTEQEKLEAEVKAEAEKRETEAKVKADDERRAKFEKAKRTAEKATQKLAEQRALQRAAQRAEQEKHAYAQQVEQLRAEKAEYEQFFNAFRSDPAAHLEKMGVTAETIAKKALEESTPETRMARMEADLKARDEAFQRRLADQDAREKAAQHEAMIERGRQEFIHLSSDEVKYPALARLAKHDPEALVHEAERILKKAAKQYGPGVYNDDDIREGLEEKYSTLFNLSASKVETGISNAASAKPTEKPLGTGVPATTTAGKPQTLTSRANVRANAPPSFDELDDKEQKRIMAEQLRARRRSG